MATEPTNDPAKAKATTTQGNLPGADKAEGNATATTSNATASNATASSPTTDPALVRVLSNLEERTRPQGPAIATEGMDVTVPGGKFVVNGVLVNCNGREIDEDGKVLHPEQQYRDPYGNLI